jgi:uncharacterized protein (TIGR02646 family)
VEVRGAEEGLVVIPVKLQPEPALFDAKVRQKGLKWLEKQGLDPTQPAPAGLKVSNYWKHCLPDMLEAYKHICAYVCVYIEEVTGFATVEHFAPKSRRLDLAYEWKNYRLTCGLMNGNKSNFEDVLDPCKLKSGTFQLNPVNGAILPNPKLNGAAKQKALETIERLKLDSAACRRVRLRYFTKYMQGQITAEFLKEVSPFVYLELKRQNLL